MNKRYQVFVSSTYADLRKERQRVIQALMEMDCIPAGMELFPAADEEQWLFIRKVIDDCDYYLLVIGGRYGSITPDGISYTEKEFDYAVSIGLKVIALVHGEPDNIPFGKSEKDPDLRARLESFKQKVMTGRLIKFWKTAEELPGLVALNLSKTIKTCPAVGWIRGSSVPNETLLLELNELRKKNAELEQSVQRLISVDRPVIDDIANIDSLYIFHGTYYASYSGRSLKYTFECSISWRDLFALIAPYLIEHPSDTSVKVQLSESLFERAGEKGSTPRINDQEFKTAAIQLNAYGLIQTRYTKTIQGGMALFWSLTDRGERLMLESRVIRERTNLALQRMPLLLMENP
ncbi:DUF4062 domain-containing protein [Nitrosomonas ureae]|uniref:DUF4062 domain-containing protein n=1 Tax=Nitrosomonas ureae TaxID=44577 RepID=A0A1H9AD54_9PROT|nr:DUF4062 domain-containing protein [Nitrosomonas ureae]SEP74471.1 protein of unknown function [Nitrosomonas ureae]